MNDYDRKLKWYTDLADHEVNMGVKTPTQAIAWIDQQVAAWKERELKWEAERDAAVERVVAAIMALAKAVGES